MSGETDLLAIFDALTVSRRPGSFVFASVAGTAATGAGVEAVVTEREGTTVVAAKEVADGHGWVYEFEAAWLTIEVHSALAAVGLTAAVSTALALAGIACNVIAGRFHDHLLVPVDDADRAMACVGALRS